MNVGEKEQAIPESWETIAIGEICNLKNGYAFKPSDWARNGLKIIRIQNLNNSLAPYNHYSGELRDRFIVDKGNLLFAWSGTPGTSFGAHVWRGEKAALNQHIFRVDFDETIILKAYFKYAINQRLTELIEKAHGGVGLRHVTKGKFEQTKIELPPYPEQHRIVAKIDALFSELDKGIESLKTAREQLKVYRQAVLKHAFEGKLTAQWREENAGKLETPEQLLARIRKEREARYQQQLTDWRTAVKTWEAKGKEGKKPGKPALLKSQEAISKREFDDLPPLPGEWCYTRLGSFIDRIEAGKSFKCDERQPLEHEIGVAKVSAVTWGEYDESESKTCVNSDKVNPNYFIEVDDFLLSRANTIELVGACVIVKDVTRRVMLSDKTLRLVFCSGNQAYFLEYLRSYTGRYEITKRSTGNQESMRNIGQDRIRNIIIPMCSSNEMNEIMRIVEEKLSLTERLIQDVDAELVKSEALRQSILKKAFSGQLVPQDPNDEPASVLLERIKAEKAQQKPKPGKKQGRRKATAG